jgi:hypothetical protein
MSFSFILGVGQFLFAGDTMYMRINGTSLLLNDTGLLINGTTNITGLAYYNNSLICTSSNGLCNVTAVTSIATGTYLTGGPITSTGTISLDSVALTAAYDARYYLLATNPLGYYNSSTFTNYYPLLTNPQGYYNSSTLPATSTPYQSSAGGWTNTSSQTTTNLTVGIGTTSPTQKLDVNGSVNISNNAFIYGGLNVTSNSYINGGQICTGTNGICGSGSGITNQSDANLSLLNVSTLNVGKTNLTTSQITEGTNLYYTDARAATAVQNTTIIRNGNNVIFGQANITTVNVSNLNVGTTNLTCAQISGCGGGGYTDAQAAAAVQNSTILRNSTNAVFNNLTTGNLTTTDLKASTTNLTTLQISENGNLYYTDDRVAAAIQNSSILRNNTNAVFNNLTVNNLTVNTKEYISATNLTTDQVTQGNTNKYYTATQAASDLQNTSIVRNGSSAILTNLNATNANISNLYAANVNFTTSIITQGTNLYCTATTVQSFSGWINTSMIQTGTLQNVSIDGNTTFFDITNNRVGIAVFNGKPTVELEINGSLNVTRGTIYAGATNLTTTQISEGTNLYYTDTRAAASVQNTSILRNSTNALFTKVIVQGPVNVTGTVNSSGQYVFGNVNVTGTVNATKLYVNGKSDSDFLVRTIVLNNSNQTTYIVAQGDVDSTCDYYRVCLNMYKNSSTSVGALGLRVNDVSSSYKNNILAYSTLANPSTDTGFMFQAVATGSNDFFGCVNIGRWLNSQGDLLASGPVQGSDQTVWFGGRVAASGNLTNVSISALNSSASGAGNLTGFATAYCLKNS